MDSSFSLHEEISLKDKLSNCRGTGAVQRQFLLSNEKNV